MTEHAAWRVAPAGLHRILRGAGGDPHTVTVTTSHAVSHSDAQVATLLDEFALPGGVAARTPELATAVAGLGVVGRFRNPDLWDALGLAIMRQVIRAAQSKKLYRLLCDTYGELVSVSGDRLYRLFPSPEIVLALSAEQFRELGLAFKMRPLQAAAAAYLEHGARWCALEPAALIGALQERSAHWARDRCRCGGGLEQRLGAVPVRRPCGAHLGETRRAVVSVARYRTRVREPVA